MQLSKEYENYGSTDNRTQPHCDETRTRRAQPRAEGGMALALPVEEVALIRGTLQPIRKRAGSFEPALFMSRRGVA